MFTDIYDNLLESDADLKDDYVHLSDPYVNLSEKYVLIKWHKLGVFVLIFKHVH